MPPDPTILAFDTSAAHCAAALLTGGEIVATRHEDMKKGQAERLFPMLDEVLAEAALDFAALDAIAVGTGPGNFTGLRIAVSAARGLSLALGIPAIGISRFDLLARAAPNEPALLLLEGPRETFYIKGLNGIAPTDVRLVARDDLPRLPAGTAVVGDISGTRPGWPERHIRPDPAPLAAQIARAAEARPPGQHPPPSPLYIRPADAAPASDPPPVILP